jgi:hypothetical protein
MRILLEILCSYVGGPIILAVHHSAVMPSLAKVTKGLSEVIHVDVQWFLGQDVSPHS